MTSEVRVPNLPESVSDATVLTWHKKPGESVVRDENLVDLETDKVVLEVPSPIDGVLNEIQAEEGAVVKADQILALISAESGQKKAGPAATEKATAPEPAVSEQAITQDDIVLTPAVRRLVKELNLDPRQIKGSGRDGRILKSDVMQYLDERGEQTDPDLAAAEPVQAIQEDISGERPEQRVPMTRLRARIAERLVEAQHTAAILTTFNEVNLQAVIDLRNKYRDQFEKKHGVKLGFMSFFVQASLEALKKFPMVNASLDGKEVVYHGYYDIGIAVGSPRGLVVPIIRDVDRMSYAEVENAIRTYGKKAHDGTLSFDELTGGTFTISNGGVYGSMLSTPILNPPQSAILGMHNIVERPVAEDGEIVIRPMMYLALSYDHRIIDGQDAVRFLVTIKEYLEDPARILLQI